MGVRRPERLYASPADTNGVSLETLTPDENATPAPAVVDRFAHLADEVTITVWGADWCGDCQRVLPVFAAILEAADVPTERVTGIAVDREKQGPGVDAYDIEYIPTIVIERNGTELARFVESADRPVGEVLAEQLDIAIDST